MSVRSITNNGDWTFGRGKADYVQRSDEIKQNVVTRLRSFTNDYSLDIDEGNPWIELFGNLGTERQILRATEKCVSQTNGVISIQELRIIDKDINRNARIAVTYTDVYNESISTTVGLTP